MNIGTQISTLGAWAYKHQSDAELQEAFNEIKKSLKRLAALDAVAKTDGKVKHSRYQDFVSVYNDFCISQSGAGAKMDGGQGKAMNNIITFLKAQSKQKNQEGAVLAWRYILSHWGNLSDFLQRQISLTQINKNLPEILTQLKNYGKANSKGTAAADDIRNAAG